MKQRERKQDGEKRVQQHWKETNKHGGNQMTGREIMINFIRDILRPKTLREILNKEMREAYLSKLEAEKALEYATSVVEYNRNRIRRLEERLNSLGDDDA
jgi:DNA-directed RNA polymerase subunit F